MPRPERKHPEDILSKPYMPERPHHGINTRGDITDASTLFRSRDPCWGSLGRNVLIYKLLYTYEENNTAPWKLSNLHVFWYAIHCWQGICLIVIIFYSTAEDATTELAPPLQ